jgi:hypothetical protein
MKTTLQTFTAFVLLATTSFVGAQQKADTKTKEVTAWTNSFPAFLKRLATIVGENPEWPQPGRFGVLTASNDKKETIWLIPQQYPLTPYGPTTVEFKGETVTWDLVVDKVRAVSESTNGVMIDFERQKLTDVHPMFNGFFAFACTVAASEKDKARKLAAGDKVRIEAKIGFDILQSVDLLFGMGPNAGKIEVSVVLKDARILSTQKQ